MAAEGRHQRAIDGADNATIEQLSPPLRTFDAISPETMAKELESQGINVSASYLRQKALELGACHMLGDAMLLMPEDVDLILRNGKQQPTSTKRSTPRSSNASVKQLASPEDRQPVAVYTPATLAKHWACSERHIRNMIATGELPSFRAGGKLLRIRSEDVIAAELAGNLQIAPLSSPAFPSTQSVAAPLKKRRKPAQRLDRTY